MRYELNVEQESGLGLGYNLRYEKRPSSFFRLGECVKIYPRFLGVPRSCSMYGNRKYDGLQGLSAASSREWTYCDTAC